MNRKSPLIAITLLLLFLLLLTHDTNATPDIATASHTSATLRQGRRKPSPSPARKATASKKRKANSRGRKKGGRNAQRSTSPGDGRPNTATGNAPSTAAPPSADGSPCISGTPMDCPGGYKCIASDLESQPRCRILDDLDERTVGEDCAAKPNNKGDNCDVEGMCINGVCQPLCKKEGTALTCANGYMCHAYAAGTKLCERECEPDLFECAEAKTYCSTDVDPAVGRFSCMHKTLPEHDQGTQGDGCGNTSHCREGLACSGNLPSGFCDGGKPPPCCTYILTEDEADACTGLTFFQAFDPPGGDPAALDIGICVAP